MEPQTFRYSEDTLKKRQWTILMLLVVVPVAVAVGMSAAPSVGRASLGLRFGSFAFVVLLLEALIIVQTRVMFKKLRELTITLTSEGVERRGGRFTEQLPYREIRRMTMRETPAGRVVSVTLRGATQVMTLHSIETMEALCARLTSHLGDGPTIQRKRFLIDWTNPLVQLCTVIAAAGLTIAVFFLVIQHGSRAEQHFMALLNIAVGLFALGAKPISKASGLRFRRFEVIVGWGMIVLGGSRLLW